LALQPAERGQPLAQRRVCPDRDLRRADDRVRSSTHDTAQTTAATTITTANDA
jgi:hypothetical protein